MLKVLILEDNQEKLDATFKVLLQTGLVDHSSVETAGNSLQARKLLKANMYDLFILDLAVPERLGEQVDRDSGRRLLGDLLEDDLFQMPSRIIGLTGYESLMGEYAADFQSQGVILVQYDMRLDTWHSPLITQLKQISASTSAERSVEKVYRFQLGIICALEVEFDAIQKLPWNFQETKIPGDPTLYIKGIFKHNNIEHEVVAALCPRMGMSTAAITSLKLIEAFRPRILAMTGITGAIRGQALLGDVIIADECWDWGMGKWSQKNDEPIFIPGPQHLTLDSDLHAAALRLSRNAQALTQIREFCDGPKPQSLFRVMIGPVASGAAVISTQSMTDHIQAQHRKLIGIEMESYGVYSAAAESTHPRPRAISIKAASDFADNQKDDSLRNFCASASAQVLRHLAENGFN